MSDPITNHEEALQLARMRPDSNLARCYIALTTELQGLREENQRFRLALEGYKKNPDECLGDGSGACVSHMAYEESTAALAQCVLENTRYREALKAASKLFAQLNRDRGREDDGVELKSWNEVRQMVHQALYHEDKALTPEDSQ